MRFYYLLFSLILPFYISGNQAIGQNLNFGTRNEKQLDSLSFSITNNQLVPVQYHLLLPYRFYKSAPFWSSDTVFSLEPGQLKTIKVYCRIVHNTLNNGEWVLQTNHWSGDHRADIRCQGTYTKTYYASTANLAEDPLKTALKTKISANAVSLGYNGARDEMYGTIDNKNDSVTCIYTNRKAKFNTRSGATSNNFNCEHTFPQGFFSENEPMKSDLHHLYSTDENANNSRSNLPFGIATPPYLQPTWNAPSLNGGGKYEPQDSHKGNCARAMMYFVLRHQDYTNFFAGQQAILRQWHQSFPPQPKDTLRHHKVFTVQTNRNPFVDYPQFADRITDLVNPSPVLSTARVQISRASVDYGFFTETTGLATSLGVWNEGNQSATITNAWFVNQMLEWTSTPPTLVMPGEGDMLRFRVKSNVTTSVTDTLRLETNDPINPIISIPVTGILTSVRNGVHVARLQLAPNPSDGKNIAINGFGQLEPGQISVTDMHGRKVPVVVDGNRISLENQPAGIYHVQVVQGSRVGSGRLVKSE